MDRGVGHGQPIGYSLIFQKLLLIYQMPKTGSQTVEASLHQCSLPHKILRFHFLSSARAEELRRASASEPDPIRRQDAGARLQFVQKLGRVIRIRNWLRSCNVNVPRLEIITAVREPISLGLASIFENHLCFAPTPDLLTLKLCSQVLQRPGMLKPLENWFDLELKPLTDIDIYEKPFPQKQGYDMYQNRFARVLVYRFEALAELSQMVRSFLGCELPTIQTRNLGSSKAYGSQYARAKKHLRLPAEFIAARYNSRMMRHFYDDEERRSLEQKWLREDATEVLR